MGRMKCLVLGFIDDLTRWRTKDKGELENMRGTIKRFRQYLERERLMLNAQKSKIMVIKKRENTENIERVPRYVAKEYCYNNRSSSR